MFEEGDKIVVLNPEKSLDFAHKGESLTVKYAGDPLTLYLSGLNLHLQSAFLEKWIEDGHVRHEKSFHKSKPGQYGCV